MFFNFILGSDDVKENKPYKDPSPTKNVDSDKSIREPKKRRENVNNSIKNHKAGQKDDKKPILTQNRNIFDIFWNGRYIGKG